jgi:hypothetical protein
MATMQKELDALQQSQTGAMEKLRDEMAAMQVRVLGLGLAHSGLRSGSVTPTAFGGRAPG